MFWIQSKRPNAGNPASNAIVGPASPVGVISTGVPISNGDVSPEGWDEAIQEIEQTVEHFNYINVTAGGGNGKEGGTSSASNVPNPSKRSVSGSGLGNTPGTTIKARDSSTGKEKRSTNSKGHPNSTAAPLSSSSSSKLQQQQQQQKSISNPSPMRLSAGVLTGLSSPNTTINTTYRQDTNNPSSNPKTATALVKDPPSKSSPYGPTTSASKRPSRSSITGQESSTININEQYSSIATAMRADSGKQNAINPLSSKSKSLKSRDVFNSSFISNGSFHEPSKRNSLPNSPTLQASGQSFSPNISNKQSSKNSKAFSRTEVEQHGMEVSDVAMDIPNIEMDDTETVINNQREKEKEKERRDKEKRGGSTTTSRTKSDRLSHSSSGDGINEYGNSNIEGRSNRESVSSNDHERRNSKDREKIAKEKTSTIEGNRSTSSSKQQSQHNSVDGVLPRGNFSPSAGNNSKFAYTKTSSSRVLKSSHADTVNINSKRNQNNNGNNSNDMIDDDETNAYGTSFIHAPGKLSNDEIPEPLLTAAYAIAIPGINNRNGNKIPPRSGSSIYYPGSGDRNGH